MTYNARSIFEHLQKYQRTKMILGIFSLKPKRNYKTKNVSTKFKITFALKRFHNPDLKLSCGFNDIEDTEIKKIQVRTCKGWLYSGGRMRTR
jgi:hypothetical protein